MNKELSKAILKDNRLNFVLTLFFSAGTVVTNILIAFILKEFVDIGIRREIEKIKYWCILSILFIIFDFAINLLLRYFKNKYLKKAIINYKNKAFEVLLSKDIDSFMEESTSVYLSAFSNDLQSIETNYLKGTIDIFNKVLLFLAGLISMLVLNPIISVVVVVSSTSSLVISCFLEPKVAKAEVDTARKNDQFMKVINNLLSGFAVIKSFKAEDKVFERFDSKNLELEEAKCDKKRIIDYLYILSRTASFMSNIILFILGIYFVILGKFTIGEIVAVIQLLNYIVVPLEYIGPLYAQRLAAKKLMYKFSKKEECERKQIDNISFNKKIILSNVAFQYNEKEIISDANIVFEKNKCYAIVGPSGAGKSTLLELLAGCHNDYQGTITIDDIELSDISKNEVFNLLSIIQQNVFIFDDTIINNITMYQKYDDNVIKDVIQKAGLSELIEEKGLDYNCGEEGEFLSGGEKQRIALARSFIRKTPIILIDEGTSALDNITAYNIEKTITEKNDITRIVVSHKMDERILKRYDEILVIVGGKIVERGAFSELIENSTYFKSLYRISNES